MQEGDVQQGAITGRLIRGGTSKGFFVRRSELPTSDDELLGELVLELFGTPDPLQVDGIGGSHSHTSKLMVVEPSDRDGVDVEYTFGQVGIEKPVVDWSGNCGNLTSAVGMFAIKEGIAEATGSSATLVLYNTNTDTIIEQELPLTGTDPEIYGEYSIDGVPGTGARIDSTFRDPAGGVFDSATPTGNVVDAISLDGETLETSLIDVTNPCVFVRAEDLGLGGTELPAELADDPERLDRLERVRGTICQRMGLVDSATEAETERPTTPFIALVAPPRAYETSGGETVTSNEIDVTARIITTQRPHHAYAMTGAMCLAAACRIPGTIPNDVTGAGSDRITIGHPKGTITVGVEATDGTIESVTVSRTARELMNGSAFYRYVGDLAKLR